MEWLAWTMGLIAILVVAVAIGYVFLQEGLSAKEHPGSQTAHIKRRRISPSRWMLSLFFYQHRDRVWVLRRSSIRAISAFSACSIFPDRRSPRATRLTSHSAYIGRVNVKPLSNTGVD